MTKIEEIHEFDPQIYPRLLWVAVGAPDSVINDMFEDVSPMDSTANAQVDYCRRVKPEIKGGVLVRFANRKAMTTSIIAHESAHIAVGIFNYIGAPIDINHQEPFSYLCGWAARCINNVKTKKKIKL